MSRAVACPIREHAHGSPRGMALLSEKGALSYRQLDERIAGMQSRLRDHGLRRGERVALAVNEEVALIPLLFALWREGITAAVLSTRLPEAGVISQCRQIACARLIRDGQPLAIDPGLSVLGTAALLGAGKAMGHHPDPAYDLDQPCTILFTSGSSGRPRAVLHTLANHYYSALGANEHIPVGAQDRWLLSLPLYHVSGIAVLFRCFLAGAELALRTSRGSLGDDMSDLQATHVSLVPTQLYRFLEEQTGRPPGRLKAVLIGGSGIADELTERAVQKGLPVHLSYGLTETASLVAATRNLAGGKGRESTVLPHRELKVDGSGEICVRGKTLFKGYVEGDQVSLPLDSEGWFHTGDLGRITANGLEVLGRRDGMLLSGGENIHPEEIELQLESLSQVEKALVIGVAHREFGQRPVAFVLFTPGAGLSDDGLRRFLETRLPRFKIPDAFYLWPEQADAGSMKAARRKILEVFSRRPGSFVRID